jgi:hypothetical protein
LSFLNSLAIVALSNRDFDEAQGLLQRVIIEGEPMSASQSLVVAAKIAVAGDFLDLARNALLAAARVALKNHDAGRRASDLSFIAALQRELLND